MLSYFVSRNAFIFSDPSTNGSRLDSQIFRGFVNVDPFIVSDICHLCTSEQVSYSKSLYIIADVNTLFNVFDVICCCFLLFLRLLEKKKQQNYELDFVVETKDAIYLVEVKGEDKINDPDAIAKKNRGIQYCEVATRWSKANGYKPWRHLFIPSKQVMPNSSFMQLAQRFEVTE